MDKLLFMNITCCVASHQEGCGLYSPGPGSVLQQTLATLSECRRTAASPWGICVLFQKQDTVNILTAKVGHHGWKWTAEFSSRHTSDMTTFCVFLPLSLFSTGEHSRRLGFSSSLELWRRNVDKKNVSRDSADKSGKWVKVQLWVNSSFQRHFWLWSADVVSHSEVGEVLAPRSLASEDQKRRTAFHDPIKMHHHNLGVAKRPRTDDSTGSVNASRYGREEELDTKGQTAF